MERSLDVKLDPQKNRDFASMRPQFAPSTSQETQTLQKGLQSREVHFGLRFGRGLG